MPQPPKCRVYRHIPPCLSEDLFIRLEVFQVCFAELFSGAACLPSLECEMSSMCWNTWSQMEGLSWEAVAPSQVSHQECSSEDFVRDLLLAIVLLPTTMD